MSIDPTKLKALSVQLHGQHIGIITRIDGDRTLFAFEDSYVDDANRPTLSLSFKGARNTLVTKPKIYSAKLAPFFSNVLPEGHLRNYLAVQAGIKPQREFFLLAALGADLPGAVTVTPLEDGWQPPEPPDAQHHPGDTADSDARLRFSLAGVQLKFSAVLEATGGLTIPANGLGGSWIVKLPSTQYLSVPENEFAMLELARAVGIEVPETRLVPIQEISGLPSEAVSLSGNALAVKRFDRGPNGERIHMEDFAQVFGLFPGDKYKNRSYANIAAVLVAEAGEAAVTEFVRRLAFSVLIGNGDMHLKNWSLLYPDQRNPTLSPAYDFVSTVPYLPNDKLGLSFGGSDSLSGITKDQLRRFADTARLSVNPLWQTVRETADATAEAWQGLPERDVVSIDLQEKIGQQIELAVKGTDN